MSSIASITIHPSQFPDSIRRDLLQSIHQRLVNHKFHYDSFKQTRKWLALHEAYSPARSDADCFAVYESAFGEAINRIKANPIHVIGLGCGGGQKDVQLLKRLKAGKRTIFYTPCDVSVPMVLVARNAALKIIEESHCYPFVCDLAKINDLSESFAPRHCSLVTFFGMIPNFEPKQILPQLASLIRSCDFLLFSANLSPGKNDEVGMKKILPQYDNDLTRDWLATFLFDLGVERDDGVLRFEIESGALNLKRIAARFHFRRARTIRVDAQAVCFRRGESIQLFFSYRYTPDRVEKLLRQFGLTVCGQWITKSEEEGVFLCRRQSASAAVKKFSSYPKPL